MSEQQPPVGPPSYGASVPTGVPASYGTTPPPPTDVLTGPGGPSGGVGGGTDAGSGGNRRWWYVAGGAVVAIALVGGGIAVAATHLKGDRDPGPAVALPGDTLAYAALDLDPSAGQKINAIQALRKFPAFSKGVKLDPTADLREKAVVGALGASHCGLSWSKDVAPWVGTDLAAAVVPTTSNGPQPVVVIGVTDDAKATSSLTKILACAGADQHLSAHVSGDWAVLAKTSALAKDVAEDGQKSSLADDSGFKTWTGRTGDPGVATLYAAAGAGPALADNLDKLQGLFALYPGMMGGGMSAYEQDDPDFATSAYITSGKGSAGQTSSAYGSSLSLSDDGELDPLAGICGADPTPSPDTPDSLLSEQKAALAKFGGGAATLRFARSGFEVEVASKSSASTVAGDGDIGSLPADTAVAVGAKAPDDWFQQLVTGFAAECGASQDQVTQGLSQLTGLDLPADLNTLLGKGVTLSLGSGLDPEKLANSTDASSVPVALRIQGDPAKVKAVLDKLRASLPPAFAQEVGYDAGGATVAVGPDAAYRAQVLKGGSLGDSKQFKDVIPHADKGVAAFYVDFSKLQPVIKDLTDDQDAVDNLAHLGAFGSSSWVDGDVAYGLMRLSIK